MDLDRRTRRLALALDGALALAVLGLGLVRDAGRIDPDPARATADYLFDLPPWALIAAHVLGAAALLLRRDRTAPVAIGLAVLAVLTPVVAALVMPYSVARYVPGTHRSLPLCALLLVGVLTGAGLWDDLLSGGTGPGDAFTPVLAMAGLTAAGLYRGARADLVGQLRARAESAHRESWLQAEQERLRDRAALALVLHDVGAHWVTLMTMQAGALSVQATDPEVRREAEELRVKGERSLTELHRLIRVLSSGAEQPDLPVGTTGNIESLEALVTDCSPGLTVRFAQEGDASPAPEHVVTLVRRVLIEALLNAVKHAGGGQADVVVSWGTLAARVCVVSRAPTDRHRMPTPGVGSQVGLAALARRCAAAGGSLEAGAMNSGPPDAGAFGVRARLPYRGSS